MTDSYFIAAAGLIVGVIIGWRRRGRWEMKQR